MFTDGKIQAWDQNLPSRTHISWPTTSHSYMWPHSTMGDGLVQLLAGLPPFPQEVGLKSASRASHPPFRSPAQAWPAPLHRHMATQTLGERVSSHLGFPSRWMQPSV